jgi:streptogramin lyase
MSHYENIKMLALRAVATWLVIPLGQLAIAAPAPSSFTFYNLPTPLSGPCDSVQGPDGALWVSNILANTIARIDPNTGDVEGKYLSFRPEKIC